MDEDKRIVYLRNEDRTPFGCVVGLDKRHIGYSLCHKNDRFNKKEAKELAEKRARLGVDFPAILFKKYGYRFLDLPKVHAAVDIMFDVYEWFTKTPA